MDSLLYSELKQTKPFRSPAQEAYLNIQRTANHLVQALNELLKAYGLTTTQYNVLRILRGAGPEGLPCGEIGDRMVTNDPDVTRLLDRMEKVGLIARERGVEDRRVVIARVTDEGRALADNLVEPVNQFHASQLGHLEEEELRMLSSLLVKVRARSH